MNTSHPNPAGNTSGSNMDTSTDIHGANTSNNVAGVNTAYTSININNNNNVGNAGNSNARNNTSNATPAVTYKCTASCGQVFDSEGSRLEHVKKQHVSGGLVNLNQGQRRDLKIVVCDRCFEPRLASDKTTHNELCSPPDAVQAYQDVRAALKEYLENVKNDENDTLFSHTDNNLSAVIIQNHSWDDDVMYDIISVFDHFPLASAVRKTWSYIFVHLVEQISKHPDEIILWQLLIVLPAWLLQIPAVQTRGESNSIIIARRLKLVLEKKWWVLAAEHKKNVLARKNRQATPASANDKKAIFRRVIRLIKQGEISRAARLLESEATVQDCNDDKVVYAVSQLYHTKLQDGKQVDKVPVKTEDDDIKITDDTVKNALAQQMGSGCALSGWHFSAIQELGRHEASLAALTTLVNRIAHGKLPNEVLDVMRTSLLTPLAKDDGGTRPIAVQEVLLRLTAKCVEAMEVVEASRHLAPYQYGVGVQGGAETVVHAIRATMEQHEDTYIDIADDRKNGYGNLKRSAVAAGIIKHGGKIPLISRYFNIYVLPTLNVRSRGKAQAKVADGLLQADVLSPLLFSLATLDALVAGQEAMGDGGRVRAFIDDAHFTGEVDAAAKGLEAYDKAAEKMGLFANEKKIQVLAMRNNARANRMCHAKKIAAPKNAILVLGVPVGTAVGEKELLAEMFAKEKLPRLIAELPDPQCQLLLARYVAASRWGFIARSMPPAVAKQTLEKHDTSMIELLAAIMGVKPEAITPLTSTEMSLPMAQGGLGIPRLQDVSPLCYLASSASAIQTLQKVEFKTITPVLRTLVGVRSTPAVTAPTAPLTQPEDLVSAFRTTRELQKCLDFANETLKASEWVKTGAAAAVANEKKIAGITPAPPVTNAAKRSKKNPPPATQQNFAAPTAAATTAAAAAPPTAVAPPPQQNSAAATPATTAAAAAPPAPTDASVFTTKMVGLNLPATAAGLLDQKKPTRKMQRKLTHALGAVNHFKVLSALSSLEAKATFLSKCGYAGSAMLQAIPSSPSFVIVPDAMRVILRMRYRLPILPLKGLAPDGKCVCRYNGKKLINSTTTVLNERHIQNCRHDQVQDTRHNAIMNVITSMCQSANTKSTQEKNANAHISNERYDVTIHWRENGLRDINTDVTVRSAIADGREVQGSKHPLYAANQGFEDKRRQYGKYTQPTDEFVPLVMEVQGAMHGAFRDLIERVTSRCHGQVPDDATWACPTPVQYWTQRIAVAHWTHTAAGMLHVMSLAAVRNPGSRDGRAPGEDSAAVLALLRAKAPQRTTPHA
jgi:hypothetical protein